MFALLQRNTSSPSGALRLPRVLLDVKCLTNVEFHSPRATGVSVVSRSSSIRIRLPSKHNEISMFSHQQVSNSLLNHWSINFKFILKSTIRKWIENRTAIDYSRERRNWKIVEKRSRSVWPPKASNKLQTAEFSTSYRWIFTNICFEFTGVKVDR